MKANNYPEKEAEIKGAIERAKDEYKSKVEGMFKTNKMKDAWTGLRALADQSSTMFSSSLNSIEGSADRLNAFYSRFDTKDFSSRQDAQKEQLLRRIKVEDEIMILEEEVLKSLRSINTNKATGPIKSAEGQSNTVYLAFST